MTCASDSAPESWLTHRRLCTSPTHSVAVVTVSNQVVATTRETAYCCRRLGTAMTTISRACMVGKQTLISADDSRPRLEPGTKRWININFPFHGGLSSCSRGIGARGTAGKDARRLLFCRSTDSRAIGTGTELATICGSWLELRNLHLLWTGSSRSMLGHWSRLERLRAWEWGRMIGRKSRPAYIQN
jgi:hypothetical protein